MSMLAERQCVPCKSGAAALRGPNVVALARQLDSGWQVVNEHHLVRKFTFKNFREALAFTNKVGEIAEAQGHHPDFHLGWGEVRISIWTHMIDGLTESDFVLAAKIDRLKP